MRGSPVEKAPFTATSEALRKKAMKALLVKDTMFQVWNLMMEENLKENK
jgi:hypothetical protein